MADGQDSISAETGGRELTIGMEIREVRKARGLTLKVVSDLTGVSVAHLSKIERGDTGISVELLTKIGQALKVDPRWFYPPRNGKGPLERSFIVRQRDRRPLSNLYTRPFEELRFEDELLSSSLAWQFYLVLSRFPAGGDPPTSREMYAFEGEQHGLVLAGRIRLSLGEEVVELAAGDSFSFPSTVPHRIENSGLEEAVVVWGMAPVRISW